MENKELRKIVAMICDDYTESVLYGMNEHIDEFPYTIACANFLQELKNSNIIIEFTNAFDDYVRDRIVREISNYLAK